MNSRLKSLLLGSASALVLAALVSGCASTPPAQPATEVSKPGLVDEQVLYLTATVKAVDKKKRVVTLKAADGNTARVNCGPECVNFDQIRVGDQVSIEFRDTTELFLAGRGEQPSASASESVKRAPKGQKPQGTASQTIEVKARVDAIDYNSRQVRLVGPEGKAVTVKAGPEVTRLNEVKVGDIVVARYTNAVSIRVTTPAKSSTKKK